MNTRLRTITIACAALWAATSVAQSPATATEPDSVDIVRELNNSGHIHITQPAELQLRSNATDEAAGDNSGISRPRAGTGFRVEVFAGNNVRTAKSRATAKRRNLMARLPQYRVYLTFQSPYWRVRVGDFRTRGEAVNEIADHIHRILVLLGEDPQREGLIKTPMRYAKALWFLTQGYRQSADEIINQAIFEYAGSKMIVVKDIEFYSMCEHHILPFFGTMTIGYIPNGKMVGLSKLARLVNVYARRLQVQERLTAQVCAKVSETLNARGVIVHCNAHHLCMKMRGVEKQEATTTTLDYCGAFAEDSELRREFLDAIHHKTWDDS